MSAIERRVRALSDIVAEHGTGAAVVADPSVLGWLGLGASEAPVAIIADGECRSVGAGTSILDALTEAEVSATVRLAVAGQTPWLDAREVVDVSWDFACARMRKDQSELQLLERAAAVTSEAQRAVRAAIREGVSERDLWHVAQAAIEARIGGSAEAVVDLLAGGRTELIGLPPGPSTVVQGDPVLFDLAPRIDGYWGDSCATYCCGVPSAQLRRRHGAIRSTLEHALGKMRPGLRACDLDAGIRRRLDDAGLSCPHHTGHGLGTAQQEPPWLLPEDATVIDEGMVIAIEPGAYCEGFGVRLEHLAVVERDGARPLTTHSIELT